jgi:hypothetical protein
MTVHDGRNTQSEKEPAFGLGLSAAPSLAVGLVPRVAYGIALEAHLRWQWALLRIQGASYAAETVNLGGGQVRGHTRLGRLALCARRKLGAHIHGGICGAGWMGQMPTYTTGFTTNESIAPTLWATGSVMDVNYWASSHLGLYVESAWLVPTTKHVFSVEGVPGEAFHSTPVAFTLGCGVSLKFL